MLFEIGDVVMLKSGGPQMTVQDIDRLDPSRITCAWIDGSGKPHTQIYALASLEAVDDEPPMPRLG